MYPGMNDDQFITKSDGSVICENLLLEPKFLHLSSLCANLDRLWAHTLYTKMESGRQGNTIGNQIGIG